MVGVVCTGVGFGLSLVLCYLLCGFVKLPRNVYLNEVPRPTDFDDQIHTPGPFYNRYGRK